MSERKSVLGVHAPPPRPTAWAALLVAVAASLVFLAALAALRLMA